MTSNAIHYTGASDRFERFVFEGKFGKCPQHEHCHCSFDIQGGRWGSSTLVREKLSLMSFLIEDNASYQMLFKESKINFIAKVIPF